VETRDRLGKGREWRVAKVYDDGIVCLIVELW
jgi:hypothetical protein